MKRVPTFNAGPARPRFGDPKRDKQRQADKNFYSSARWVKYRRWYLSEHPLCVDCQARGITQAAEHVHHIKPRKPFPELAFEETNCKALCVPCHNAQEER